MSLSRGACWTRLTHTYLRGSAKLVADQNLSRRTAFPWTIVRPGSLLDHEATGKITAGQTGMGSITVRMDSRFLTRPH